MSPVLDWGYPEGRAWPDFNGDGKADFCRLVGGENLKTSYLKCTLSDGNGFGQEVTSGVVDWGYKEGRAWVDFNGDGKADYCRVVGNPGDVRLRCTLSAGASFGAEITSDAIDWGYPETRVWLDVNGDGKADFCRVIGNKHEFIACTLSAGTKFGPTRMDLRKSFLAGSAKE
jgi:hypothetical protein